MEAHDDRLESNACCVHIVRQHLQQVMTVAHTACPANHIVVCDSHSTTPHAAAQWTAAKQSATFYTLPAGLEPAALRLTASRSNQLSYGSTYVLVFALTEYGG